MYEAIPVKKIVITDDMISNKFEGNLSWLVVVKEPQAIPCFKRMCVQEGFEVHHVGGRWVMVYSKSLGGLLK